MYFIDTHQCWKALQPRDAVACYWYHAKNYSWPQRCQHCACIAPVSSQRLGDTHERRRSVLPAVR